MLFVAPNEKDLVHQPDSKLERDGQSCIQVLIAQLKTSSFIVTKMNTSVILLSEVLGVQEKVHRWAQSSSCQGDCTHWSISPVPQTPSVQLLGESASLPYVQGGGVSPLASCSGILSPDYSWSLRCSSWTFREKDERHLSPQDLRRWVCKGVTAPQSFLKMNIYPWYLRSLVLTVSLLALPTGTSVSSLKQNPSYHFVSLLLSTHLLLYFYFFPGLGSPGLSLLGYSEAKIFWGR